MQRRLAGLVRRKFERQFAGPADNVLLFLRMGMPWRSLGAPGAHELFAVFGFFRQIDQGEDELVKSLKPKSVMYQEGNGGDTLRPAI